MRLEEKGDLISRTELKKCAIPCEIQNGALTDLCVPLYQIDNAPTVETYTKEDMRKEYKRGITDAYKVNPPI